MRGKCPDKIIIDFGTRRYSIGHTGRERQLSLRIYVHFSKSNDLD